MAYEDNGTMTTLAELARQVRPGTLQMLQVSDRNCLTWAPPGTSNHLLWHAGHALWLQDALTVQPLTGTSDLPPGWSSMFGQHSEPGVVSAWPAPRTIAGLLEAQLARILSLLSDQGATIVAQASAPQAQTGWPLLAGMIHGWHDEARHQGEMYLLYKLFRRRSC